MLIFKLKWKCKEAKITKTIFKYKFAALTLHNFKTNHKATMIKTIALYSVAQWIEGQPAGQRVTDSIPSQGTCLGGGPDPQLGAHKRQPHIDASLPLLPPFPSL